MKRIDVAVLGANGMIGKRLCQLLQNHPFFRVMCTPTKEEMCTHPSRVFHQLAKGCKLLFSALPEEVASEWECLLAKEGLSIFSVSPSHRCCSDIPLLIPEVNPEHLDILSIQQKERGWSRGGWIVAKPNCTLQGILLPLFPLHRLFPIRGVAVTTLQAVSGAGKNFVLEGNIIPYIAHEEEKMEQEWKKILGTVGKEGILPSEEILFSSQCNRVPVKVGHLSSIGVSFVKKPQKEELLQAWEEFVALPQTLALPSAPRRPVLYLNEFDRPQPAKDSEGDFGMSIKVGRLRESSFFDFQFVSLSHNLLRGGAGGAILGAELAYYKGLLS